MAVGPNPERLFVQYLFERLLFERILARSGFDGCCIDPEAVADKFDYILHYYFYLGLKKIHDYRSEAIRNLALNTTAGVVIHMANMRGQYKVIPASVAQTFDSGQEKEDAYGDHVHCSQMSNKQVKEFRRDWTSKVPQEYQDEIDLLVRILKENGLMSGRDCGGTLADEFDLSDDDEDLEDYEVPHDVYVAKLESARLMPDIRLRREQLLVTTIKNLTSMDVIVLSSFAKGANISDYDVELLLTPRATASKKPESSSSPKPSPSGTEGFVPTMTLDEITNHLKRAGFKSVEYAYYYHDSTCDINVPYASFYDPRNELSCQITLSQLHPLGVPLQKLIQAYMDLDGRVERLVYAAQQILSEHGNCRRFLNNYAITLMVITFLQERSILPKLQHHRERRSTDQPLATPQTQAQHQQQGRPPAMSIPKAMSRNQKRALTRRRRNQTQSGSMNANAASNAAADLVEVNTSNNGCIRMIDCHFDQAMAQNKAFGKRNISTVGDLLSGFLAYFGLIHNYTGHEEVSIVCGSLSQKSDMMTAEAVTSPSLGTNNIAANNNSGGKPSTPIISERPLSSSASTTSTDAEATLRSGKASSTSTEKPQQPPADRQDPVGLVVRDPFVNDRNVTRLCSGWKLAATLGCFRRALATLEDEDEFSRDSESYDDDDDSDDMDLDSSDDELDSENEDSELYDGDGDDEDSVDERKRRSWRYRKQQQQRRCQVVSQQRRRRQRQYGIVTAGQRSAENALAVLLAEELWKDMVFLFVTERVEERE
ncbi:hypothetical protein B0O80DRAFT_487499 [Mortierella sp. GBAus27b]|nr:hypothetical protein BGX31_009235 [Mortierella sp. GBA43]KAI8353940.1 hypothetical protein B0O80DRAFT_487499 [Mortierella sp. GBAus27b]